MKKLIILALLITAGLLLQVFGLFDVEKILLFARGYADHWWLVVILILAQTVLFTFALAGSLFLWVAAPLYPPLLSTFILATGAALGGTTAYFFSRNMTDEWTRRIENSHAYKILHEQDNFFTLFALRVFPAFPHALVNYSSGILKVKLSHFIPAAFLGVGIKSYVYSNIIYNAASTLSFEELLNLKTFGPLLLLSVLTLAGVYLKYRFSKR
ncbi:MAG: VTT domain-containing protein [Gammaproteobacteria bacterium]|nr:VTT domain-containing protein [Gammaproteobacteria bacterium]